MRDEVLGEKLECSLIDMDEDFPLKEDDTDTDTPRAEKIYAVLEFCFLHGCCPNDGIVALPHNLLKLREFLRYCYEHSQPREPLMNILDFDLPDTSYTQGYRQWESVKRCREMMREQCSQEFVDKFLQNDQGFQMVLAIGYNHRNWNFLLYLMDSYQRDKVYIHRTEHRQVDIQKWINGNHIMRNKLSARGISTEFLCEALRANMRHWRLRVFIACALMIMMCDL